MADIVAAQTLVCPTTNLLRIACRGTTINSEVAGNEQVPATAMGGPGLVNGSDIYAVESTQSNLRSRAVTSDD